VAASPSELIARLERTPFSRWHRKARIVMGSATFFDAYNALSLAFALPVLIGPWHITPAQIGVLLGASYVGQLAGALLFGWLAEKYGRVSSAAGAVAIMSVMNLVCALAGSFNALLVCRIVQGIGVGGEMPVAAAYINELSRAQGRGRFFLLYEMIFPLGLMAAGQIGAWLVPIFGWKIMFLIGGIPGLLITGLVARLPESPRWLVSQGRLEDAEKIIGKIESSVSRGARATAQPEPALPAAAASLVPTLAQGRWSEVLSAAYRGRTTVVWALWACSYFVSNGLNNWMPSLYNTIYHLPLQQSLRAASMTNVAQVALLLVCALVIDRAGRRNWMVTALLASAALLALLGFVAAQSVIAVMILATVSYGAVGSANAVLYLYTPEIYPTRMRAIATGLATSWLRLTSAIGPPIVGLMVGSAGVGSVFIMFAAVSFAGAIVARQMIETRGRKLEEIAT
jgi:MFS transporter, putative metabolite:H+ symporter